jgi:dienelactone hydrolase
MNMQCPGCGKVYEFLPEHSESQFQCVQCGMLFGVPRIPETPQQPVVQQPAQQEPQPEASHPYDPFAGVDPSAAMSGELNDEFSSSRRDINFLPFILGGVALLVLLFCGGVIFTVVKVCSKSPEEQVYHFTPLSEPVPTYVDEFPERPVRWEYWEQGGTRFPFVKVELGVPPGKPGYSDNLWILLPPRMPSEAGAVTPGSQGCVFFVPTNGMICGGMYLAEEDLVDCAPYAEAGFIVIAYEVDGFIYDADDPFEVQQEYAHYKASRAGLVNAEHAIQYVLARLPEVDPGRLYAAGHSMSGSLALRLAAHDDRITGCVAYAPEIDLSPYWNDGREQALNDQLGDDEAVAFLDHYSPFIQEEQIQCDLFLFHARDDELVEFHVTQSYAERMAELPGRELEFHIANSGGHSDAMRDEGIPAGVQFLRKIDAKKR